MPTYLVERYLRDFTSGQIGLVAARCLGAADRMTREGTPVRYLRSTFVPGEKRCLCLFEAPSASAVRTASERAGLPFERVIEVVEIAAGDADASLAGLELPRHGRPPGSPTRK